MKIKTFVIGYVLALAIFLFAKHKDIQQPDNRFVVVDLTHPFHPAQDAVDTDVRASSVENATDFTREILAPENYGTRLDAPAHLAPGLWTIDQIPAERLVAPLVVLNVRRKTEKNPDYQIGIEDIANWEDLHGHIPQGSVVIADTGWAARWNTAKDYRNADDRSVMHFPGYSSESARFLVEGRTAIALGIDTLSVDYGPSKDFLVHKYALNHSLYQLENVANLAQAPESGATVVIAPAKVPGAVGAPVRILAMTK